MKYGRWTLTAGLLAGGGGWVQAQESQDQLEQQQDAREIVIRIRETMREVNQILLQGSNPDTAVARGRQVVSDLENLLDEAETKAELVVAGLDELIELASKSPP